MNFSFDRDEFDGLTSYSRPKLRWGGNARRPHCESRRVCSHGRLGKYRDFLLRYRCSRCERTFYELKRRGRGQWMLTGAIAMRWLHQLMCPNRSPMER